MTTATEDQARRRRATERRAARGPARGVHIVKLLILVRLDPDPELRERWHRAALHEHGGAMLDQGPAFALTYGFATALVQKVPGQGDGVRAEVELVPLADGPVPSARVEAATAIAAFIASAGNRDVEGAAAVWKQLDAREAFEVSWELARITAAVWADAAEYPSIDELR